MQEMYSKACKQYCGLLVWNYTFENYERKSKFYNLLKILIFQCATQSDIFQYLRGLHVWQAC